MTSAFRLPTVTALAASLTFGLLVACQPTPDAPDYSRGEATLAACAATACTRLDLDHSRLGDYAQIADMTHVTALMISYTDFANLADIAPMSQLTELHIGDTEVTNLSGLTAFPHLTLLHAQGIAPDSWALLANLSGLRELAIGHSTLTDLSFIAENPNLQRLRIFTAGDGASFEGLGRHRGLREIELNTDAFTDLSPLLDLPNLRTLAITVTQWDREQNIYSDDANAEVIRRLKARGVRVSVEELIVVC